MPLEIQGIIREFDNNFPVGTLTLFITGVPYHRLFLMGQICILYGFPYEMDFSPRVSKSHLRTRGWDSETSGEKSISRGKPCKMHFCPPPWRSHWGGDIKMLGVRPSVRPSVTNLVISHTLHFKAC